MKLERKKGDVLGAACVKAEVLGNSIGAGRGTKARDEVDRKKVEDMLNEAEPWKEMRAETEKIVSGFLDWERENKGKGRIEVFLKTLDN